MDPNPIEYASQLRSAAIGYFNNDIWLDIVMTNAALDNIAIFLAHGNGTFAIALTYSTGFGSNPCMVAVEDLNHDQRLDVAVANFRSNNILVFFLDLKMDLL
jgi:hypothetical protein